MQAKCRVVLENRLDEMQRFVTSLTEFARVGKLSDELVFNIQLCMDELFTNIVSYGYEDDDLHLVEVDLTVDEEEVRIGLVDDAKPFNPLQEADQPDLDASLDERKIGGVGIHLVKTLMDEVSYKYEDNKNHLLLVKKLEV